MCRTRRRPGGGAAASPERKTVGQYLDRWLEQLRPQVSPKTLERYGQLARWNLVPVIGNTLIAKLTPMQIGAAYSTLLSGGLAPQTVCHCHKLLSQSLRHAVRWRSCRAIQPTTFGRRGSSGGR